MNLINDKWIYVNTHKGIKKVSLQEIFTDQSIIDVCGDFFTTITLYNLFISIVHGATKGPKDREEWLKIKDNYHQSVVPYLNHYKSKFEFYNDFFYRYKNLSYDNPQSWDHIDLERSSGSNHTFFSTTENNNYSDAEKVMNILKSQLFLECGTACSRKWDEEENIFYKKTKGVLYSEASLFSSNSYIVYLNGKNLLETIWLNLINKEYLGKTELGKPIWENKPNNWNDKKHINTYLGQIMPTTKLIDYTRDSNDIYFTLGFKYPCEFNEHRIPFICARKSEGKKFFMKIDIEKDIRKDLALIFEPSSDNFFDISVPIINNARDAINKDKIDKFRIIAGGIKTFRAKKEDMVFQEVLCDKNMIKENFSKRYKQIMQLAEYYLDNVVLSSYNVFKKLYNSVTSKNNVNKVRYIKNTYWDKLSNKYNKIIDSVVNEETVIEISDKYIVKNGDETIYSFIFDQDFSDQKKIIASCGAKKEYYKQKSNFRKKNYKKDKK